MVRVLGHRQTKGAATDHPSLPPPRTSRLYRVIRRLRVASCRMTNRLNAAISGQLSPPGSFPQTGRWGSNPKRSQAATLPQHRDKVPSAPRDVKSHRARRQRSVLTPIQADVKVVGIATVRIHVLRNAILTGRKE